MGAPAGSGQRWAAAIVVAAAVVPGALLAPPAAAISLRRAEKIALRILRPGRSHAVVYRWRRVLSARSIIEEPGPGRLQSGRTRLKGTALVTPLSRRRVGHRAFMFWKDLLPTAALPHPNVLLVLDARTGRVLRHTSIAWWPIVNGRRTAWSARATGPPAAHATAAPAAVPPTGPPRAHAAAAPGAANSRVIEIGDFSTPDAVPDFRAISSWAVQTTGRQPWQAANVGGLEYAISTSYAQGARDIVIFVSGHQFVPIGFLDILGRSGDALAHAIAGKPPGPYVSLASGPGLGHTWKQQILTAQEVGSVIASAKQRLPGLTTTVIVETCGAGNWGPALRGTADRIVTSVGPNAFTLAPPRSGGPSPFTKALIGDSAAALALNGSLSLGGAIASAAPSIGRTTEALGAQQDGGTYPQEPQEYTTQSVSGQILSRAPCNPEYAFLQPDNPLYCDPPAGEIAVEVALGFSVGEGVGGTVTISPPGAVVDSSKPPPALANPALGDVFFFARAGTAVKLTANHGPGAFLDGWQVQNGARCVPPNGTPSDHIDGGSPGSCSFTVSDPYGLRRFQYEAIAFFLKCPPPGNYLGLRQGELIDCPGVSEG